MVARPASPASVTQHSQPRAGKEQTMETSSLGLTLFLTLDVIASIALAVWLGAQTSGGHSDWDR